MYDNTAPIGPGLPGGINITGNDPTIDDSVPAISSSSFWDSMNKVIANVTGAASQAYQATVLSQRPIIAYPGSTVTASGAVVPSVTTGMNIQLMPLLLVAIVVLLLFRVFRRG